MKNELALRFDSRDEPVAARQRLHVIKQGEEDSLEDFLQRVQIATLQQLATEAFLRGCKFKDAAKLVMNEALKSIQEACRRVKTVNANKKAVGATKVSFQERAFTFQEETRVASIDKKVDDLVETFHRAIPSYRSPSRSPSRYPVGPQAYNNWPRQQSPAGYRDGSPYRQSYERYRPQYRSPSGQPGGYRRGYSPNRSPGRGGDDRGPGNQAAYYRPPMPGPPAYPSKNRGYYSDSRYQSPGPSAQQTAPRPNNHDSSYPSPRPTFQGHSFTQSALNRPQSPVAVRSLSTDQPVAQDLNLDGLGVPVTHA